MHYYIDGYNLLFRILRAGDDVRKQREQITLDIERKVSLLGLDITLVFDSHYQEDDSTRSHLNSLEIVFTAAGETADEYILQELKECSNPTQHTVVTSDKKLARLCQLRLGKTESVDEFLAWIGKRYKNKLRQKKNPPLQQIVLLVPVEPPKPAPIAIVTPISSDSPQNCFDYYLSTFEKEFSSKEKDVTPPKKPQQEPKKIKVKKRKLTKEEKQLSDLQRWKKAFEKGIAEEDLNNIF